MKQYPQAYLDYLIQFHAYRDYFECHEIMEGNWKQDADSERSTTWAALIQIAVAVYHERRGNAAGAVKMLKAALRNARQDVLAQLGLDAPLLIAMLRDRLQLLEARREGMDWKFTDLDLPIQDDGLLCYCRLRSEALGTSWCAPSDPGSRELIDRHKLRDRSDVIAKRQQELDKRNSPC